MTINQIQDEVIEEFNDFADWMDKYQMLIDLGNELSPLDNQYKTKKTSSKAVKVECGCNAISTEHNCISQQIATL